jgi:hypothetical protein
MHMMIHCFWHRCRDASALPALIFLLVLSCCGDGDITVSKTTKEDLVPTPAPPDRWYPFAPGDEHALKHADYENKIPLSAADATCGTKVKEPPAIDMHDTGKVIGGLKFNLFPRGKGSAAEANQDNTNLGPIYEKNSGVARDWYLYKFEVEITYTPVLKDGFYGQMISAPFEMSATPDITFTDDSPENDTIGKQWFLAPGQKKSDFPVVEVQNTTVRWIDAPGGSQLGMGIADKKMFVIVYAGACKKVTYVKVLKFEYPKGKKPTITYIEPDKLKDQVKSYKFK